jgi:hypothetical protein
MAAVVANDVLERSGFMERLLYELWLNAFNKSPQRAYARVRKDDYDSDDTNSRIILTICGAFSACLSISDSDNGLHHLLQPRAQGSAA